jgi:hypothetical protein
MMNPDCKLHRAEIEESAGGLPQSAGLRAHLATCPHCDHFRQERAAIRQLVGGLEKVTAPADFEFRLRARLAAADSARRFQPFRLRFVPGVASVALAACFLVFSASIYLRRESTTNPTANPSSGSALTTQSLSTSAPLNAHADQNVEIDRDRKQGSEIVSLPPRVTKHRGASNIRAGLVGKDHARLGRGAGTAATFDSRSAPVLNIAASASREQTSSRTTTPAVGVRTPAVPLQVVLRDERGAARLVSMRSVSFGAQELVRRGRNVVPVSYTDKEGVW